MAASMKTETKAAGRPAAGRPPERPEQHFTGLGVSAGIAVGPAHVVERGLIDVPEYRIEDDAIEAEIARFGEAVSLSVSQIHSLQAKAEALPEEVAGQLRYLLDAHLLMLSGSRLVRGVEARIRDARINAEAAIQMQLSEIAQAFAGMEDSYLAGKIDDVREASGRLVRNLTRAGYQAFSSVPSGTIIIAEEITPGRYGAHGPGTHRRLRCGARRGRGAYRDHGALARTAGGARCVGPGGRRAFGRHRGGGRRARRARDQPPARRRSRASSAAAGLLSGASANSPGCARSPRSRAMASA